MARISGAGTVGSRRALAGWRLLGALIAIVLAVVIAVCAQTSSPSASRAFRTADTATLISNSTPALAPLVTTGGVLKHSTQTVPATTACEHVGKLSCYNAKQLERAYGLLPLFRKGIDGRGSTIVVVDPFGSPSIVADLKTFDRGMGIRNPPSLKIIRPVGGLPKSLSRCSWTVTNDSVACWDYAGWAVETSIDVEWSHAMAPGAKIVLVETPANETEGAYGFKQIVAAENYVIKHHIGQVITQSFGATEQTFASRAQIYGLRSAYVNAVRAGVTVLAGSGDYGATSNYCQPANGCANSDNILCCMAHRAINWPASDPLVTAVGGTKLTLNASGKRIAPDIVWNDLTSGLGISGPVYSYGASGGGLSTVFRRPTFQNRVSKVVGDRRGTPDISMSASIEGGADFYDSSNIGENGWNVQGGTSLASPLFAGIVALADQEAGRSVGYLNPLLYELARHPRANGIVPITRGTNTLPFCLEGDTNDDGGCLSKSDVVTVKGYNANGAYNNATGLGTIDASKFVPALAKLVRAR